MKPIKTEIEPGVSFSYYYREPEDEFTLVFIHGLARATGRRRIDLQGISLSFQSMGY